MFELEKKIKELLELYPHPINLLISRSRAGIIEISEIDTLNEEIEKIEKN